MYIDDTKNIVTIEEVYLYSNFNSKIRIARIKNFN